EYLTALSTRLPSTWPTLSPSPVASGRNGGGGRAFRLVFGVRWRGGGSPGGAAGAASQRFGPTPDGAGACPCGPAEAWLSAGGVGDDRREAVGLVRNELEQSIALRLLHACPLMLQR